MTNIIFPYVRDAEGIAADYFDSLIKELYTHEERTRIIEECVPSLVLVIVAGTSLNEGDKIGARILAAFMRDLSLQVSSHNQ